MARLSDAFFVLVLFEVLLLAVFMAINFVAAIRLTELNILPLSPPPKGEANLPIKYYTS